MDTTRRNYAITAIGEFFRNEQLLKKFHTQLPFLTDEEVSNLSDLVEKLKQPIEAFWSTCGLCGKPIQTETEATEMWVGPINAPGGQKGYIHAEYITPGKCCIK